MNKKIYTPIHKEDFRRLLRHYNVPESIEDNILYDLYRNQLNYLLLTMKRLTIYLMLTLTINA